MHDSDDECDTDQRPVRVRGRIRPACDVEFRELHKAMRETRESIRGYADDCKKSLAPDGPLWNAINRQTWLMGMIVGGLTLLSVGVPLAIFLAGRH